MIGDALINDIVDQLLDFSRRRFLQTARSALNRVGQADDRAFFGLRFRSAVTKTFLAHFGNIMLAQVHDFASGTGVLMLLKRTFVKIVHKRSSMVLLDYVDDALI